MLDVTECLDKDERDLLILVSEVLSQMGLKSVLVGASARNLIYEHKYGIDPKRATEDSDFAVQIQNWIEFENLKAALGEIGFKGDVVHAHRMFSPSGRMLDIVPFGDIADAGFNIHWPPDQSFQMKVLGFKEAWKSSELVRISNNPIIDIRVVDLPGIAFLKLVAWTDREHDKKLKDAMDFVSVLASFEKVLGQKVFDRQDLLEKYQGDVSFCAAHILGERVTTLISKELYKYLMAFKCGELGSRNMSSLLEDINRNERESEFAKNENLVDAFFDGLNI